MIMSTTTSSSSSSPPHQYPQEIQLKLYQAFIFSIPILFSIILFLLFYLFYLKRRAGAASSFSPILPRTINNAAPPPTHPCFKNDEVKNKLCEILFDDSMKARESTCCVCLGEFQVKEELLQVPTCKHVFHIDCIRHWLRNNSTCPLCRAPAVSDYHFKSCHHQPPQNMQTQAAVPPPTQIPRLQHSEGSSSSGGNAC